MQFSVESGLSTEIPQYTLTCVSTGGPATTVTWTRNTKDILRGITVLRNPMAANYSHILTLTERLEGQYECNVSNNKPSMATKSIHVQGRVRIFYYHCVKMTIHYLLTTSI